MAREGNNPKRRVVKSGSLTDAQIQKVRDAVVYEGSGHHKRYPLDYGFERTNPVPTKSLCDSARPIRLAEARQLFDQGLSAEMMSALSGGFPKYIWAVDGQGVVYEAKCDPKNPGRYHGYPIEDQVEVRDYIFGEWERRAK